MPQNRRVRNVVPASGFFKARVKALTRYHSRRRRQITKCPASHRTRNKSNLQTYQRTLTGTQPKWNSKIVDVACHASGSTWGSLTSSHQDSATTPGRMKHARLSTWPFTTCTPSLPHKQRAAYQKLLTHVAYSSMCFIHVIACASSLLPWHMSGCRDTQRCF